jgi:hypothetical protein
LLADVFPKNDPLAPLDQDNNTSLVIDEMTPPPPGALFAGRIPRKPKPGPSVVVQIMGAVVEDVEMMDPKQRLRTAGSDKGTGKFAREGKICGESLTQQFD